FVAKTGDGEVFAWSGDVSANPVRSAGTFRLGALRLPKYAPYARDYARFQIAGGLIDVATDYRLDAGTNTLELDVSNMVVYLHQLSLKAPDSDETVTSIPSLSIEKTEASLENQTAHVGLIKSPGGSILARREKDSAINLLANLILPPSQTNDIA